MFRISSDTNILGSGEITRILLPPRFFLEHFGNPIERDKYEVSGQYFFTNESGDFFFVYDWKSTTLYHGKDSGFPTPEEFWKQQSLEQLHIGGKQDANPKDFMGWLTDEYLIFRDTKDTDGLINVFWP